MPLSPVSNLKMQTQPQNSPYICAGMDDHLFASFAENWVLGISMVSNCLKECLLNLGVVCPTEFGQRRQVDIYDFLIWIANFTHIFGVSGQSDRI